MMTSARVRPDHRCRHGGFAVRGPFSTGPSTGICTASPLTVMEEPRLEIGKRESSTGAAPYNVAAVLRRLPASLCALLRTWLPVAQSDLLGKMVI
jgi:hypothetical protein